MVMARSSLTKRVALACVALAAIGGAVLAPTAAVAVEEPPTTAGEYSEFDFIIDTQDSAGNIIYTETVGNVLPPVLANPEAGGLSPCWRTVDDGTLMAQGAEAFAAQSGGGGGGPGGGTECADGSIGYGSLVKSYSGCRTLYAGINRYSATGFRLYRFTQQKYYCWSGGRITQQSYTAYLSYSDGDRYLRSVEKWDYNFSRGGYSDGGHRSYTKGTVEACIISWGCYGVAYPSADIYVYGDGTYYWSAYSG